VARSTGFKVPEQVRKDQAALHKPSVSGGARLPPSRPRVGSSLDSPGDQKESPTVTHPQRTALIGAAVAAVVAGFALFSRERIPEYAGRDAWSWFHQFQSGPGASPLNAEAEDAFAAMGDAATPFLWSVINQPDPGRIRRAWDHLKAQLPWHSNRASWPGPQRNPRALALQILERIHPSATALWPLIQPAATNPAHPRYLDSLRLAGALGADGTVGLSALTNALTSTNPVVVAFSLRSLASLGPDARDAVPSLIQALDGPNAPRALQALGSIGSAARPAIPRIERMGDPAHGDFSGNVAVALRRIDPEHPALDGLIARAADRSDPMQASASITCLGEIGPAAKPALPVLLAALAEPHLALPAAQAVQKVDPRNPDAVPLLLMYLRGGDLNAAAWLARWEPPHEAGIAALAKVVESDPQDGQRLWAMYVLYEVGPRARAAIPALEAAAHDPHASVRDAARCTLRKLRGER